MTKALRTLVAGCVAMAVSLGMMAEDALTVAVLPFAEHGVEIGQGAKAAELLSAELSSNPKLRLVERGTIDKALKSAPVDLSRISDSNQLSRIGRLTGADVLVSGSVSSNQGQLGYSSQSASLMSGILTSNQGQICLAAQVTNSKTNRSLGVGSGGSGDIDQLSKDLGKQLAKCIEDSNAKSPPKMSSAQIVPSHY